MAIIIGAGAIDRSSATGSNTGLTCLDFNYPANLAGIITSFEVWLKTSPSTGFQFGTAYGSGTSWNTRDVSAIGNVASGSKQTFTGLSVDCVVNDVIATYATGPSKFSADTTGAGRATYTGNAFGDGEKTYTVIAARTQSVYATGVSVGTVTTQAATSVISSSFTGNGNITDSGGTSTDVTRRGFCYLAGSSGDPTVANSVAYDDGSFSAGAYTKSITGLTPGTAYRVRAYAINIVGTFYGSTVDVTTPIAPTVTTQAATDIASTSCTGNGNVTATGGATVTRRGFCYLVGSSGDPTVADSVAYDDGTFSTGTFTKSITGLSPGTAYRVRAYAVNSAGTSYGTTVDVTTAAVAPTVTTQAATSILDTSCTGNGNITATGGAVVTRRGFCYLAGTSGEPTVADSVAYDDGTFGTGAFTKSITGLSANTAYRVRAYAVNSAGTSYGTTVDVTTSAVAPTVTTQAATDVASTSCTGNGNITATGGANATRRGFCYSEKIVASGSVSLSNSKISAIDGTAFIDFNAANILTDYAGGNFKLTVYDSTGKKIVGYIKAAGTGETWSEKITGNNYDPSGSIENWLAYTSGGSGNTLTYDATLDAFKVTLGGTVGTNNGARLSTSFMGTIVPNGAITREQAEIYLPSGHGFTDSIYATDGGTFSNRVPYHYPPLISINLSLVDQWQTIRYPNSYLTGADVAGFLYVYAAGGVSGGVFYFRNPSLAQLITPSATGVTITSAADGSVYNFESKETGFNYSDASGYTYEIEIINPTTADSVAYDDGSFSTGAFTKSITGLSVDTTYRVRAYAVNSAGTSYGTTVDATTSSTPATVTTQAATDVASTSCTGNGNITSTGGSNCTRRGFCYMVGTSGDPTTANNTVYDDGSFGTGTFTKSITGLNPGTAYRVRAYAVNSGETVYGTTVDMTTSAVASTVTTQAATDVASTTCTGNGNITDTGGATVTRRGFCYMAGTSGDPTTANSVAYDDGTFSTGAYAKFINGLTAATAYRIRAYAVNSVGTSYGATVQITTLPHAPTVTTQAASSVADTSCTGNGNITSIGGTTVTRRGFCYLAGSSGDPTTANSVAYDDGSFGTGAFTKSITELLAGTAYRVRAYAINAGGTSYGATVNVTTTTVAPTVTTQAATDVVDTSCTGNGNITATGGAAVTRRGFCYVAGSSGDPTVADSVVYDDGSFVTGAYEKSITGLLANTSYRVRAYAVNSIGTSYGTTVQVITTTVAPTVTTQAVTDILTTSCTGNGNVTATGGAAVTRRGFCYLAGTSGDPTTADSVAYSDGSFGTGAFTKSITGLSPGTAYRVRSYAVNSEGTSYGTTVDVTTAAGAPTVTTQAATDIAATSCTGNGNITATGGADATQRGFCYMTGSSGDPTTADSVAYDDGTFGTGAFTKSIPGLLAGTAYRVRAYAINAGGTSYGTTVAVTTTTVAPTVTTQAASGISDTNLTGNGDITATGGAAVTRRGFCYMAGTSGDPTTANSVAYDDGSFGVGAYTKFINGLTAATAYRIRAYAVNSVGTSYGDTLQVTTADTPTKRLFNANFIIEKNKRADGPKPVNLVTFGFSTPVYASDCTVTPSGGSAHQGIIKSWSFIDTSISRTPGAGVVGSIDIADIEITVINSTTPRFSANFTAADPPENITVSIYQWFAGTVYAEKEIIFKGTIYGAIHYDEYTCTFTVRSIFSKYNKQIGADKLITAALFPAADPDDIGKMSNIGYGSLRDVPCRAIKAGVVDTLRDDLTISATSFYVSAGAVVDFPSGGVVVQIDDEKISGTYSRTTHRFTACTRAYGGTTAAAHDKGAAVAQVLTEYIYEIFGHPAHAIADVRVDGIKQTTGYTAYTGQTGDVLTGYKGRAVIKFTALPVIKKQVNLSVSTGNHAHTAAETIMTWEFDTTSSNLSPGAATIVINGIMSYDWVQLAYGDYINCTRSKYVAGPGLPLRYRVCYATADLNAGTTVTLIKGSWITCNPATHTWDWFNAYVYPIAPKATTRYVEVWLEIKYSPTASSNPATGVALSGNSSADTVIGSLITCDASGYRDDSSGTYTGTANSLIARPDHVLKHLWSVVMGAPAADINTAAFAAAGVFYAASAYAFALLISQQTAAGDLLTRLAVQCRSRFIVTAYGRAGLFVRELDQVSSHAITQNEIKYDSMSIQRSATDDIINLFNIGYDLDHNKDDGNIESYNSVIKFTDATSVARYGTKEWKGGGEVFCFNAVRLAAMAQDVGDYYLAFHKRSRKMPTFGVFLDNMEIEPADIIDITHPLDSMTSFVVEVQKVIHHIGSTKQIDYLEVITVENGT